MDSLDGRRPSATGTAWRHLRPWRIVCCALALLVLGPLAGCGGGGGGGGGSGSGSMTRHPRGFYETQEYFASAGLEALEASSAYAAGAAGDGVVVGVIDTGIDVDHPEFDDAIHKSSTDIVSGSDEFLGDVSGHGTAVAGVIAARRNDALAHGVAFDAELLVVRADAPGSCPGACAFDPSDVARATDHAVARGARVINYSIGGAGSLDGELGDALKAAVKAGRIVVLSAGNDGGADPIFPAVFAGTSAARGRAIAVGALDADGEIASFSNRAGGSKKYFLVAPGVDLLAPALGGGGTLVSGTSFAAPHVTGAVALVLDAAPFLSAREVVDLLLETATDLGVPGTDEVYGRGLLNLRAALGPQGPLTVPLGDRVDAASVDLAETGLRLGQAFGPGPGLGRAIFLDGYGRPYWMDLDDRRATTETGPDLVSWLAPDGERLAFEAPLGVEGALLQLAAPLERASFAGSSGGSDAQVDERFALSATLGDAGRLTVAHGWSLQGQFGLASEDRSVTPDLLTGGIFASPYLGLTDGGDGLALAHRLDDRWSLRLGLARAERDEAGAYGSSDNTVMLGELVGVVAERLRLGLQLGQLEEQDRVLDASGGGALGLGDGSSTTFLGLAGRTELSSSLELFGQANLGLTRGGGTGQSLVRDLSMLYSSSFGVGLGRRELVVAGDRLTVAVSQPLRVEAGEATLDRPLGRTFDGRIVRRRDRIDLTPEGRELDLEVGYRVGLAGIGDLSLNWLTRIQPGHDAEARPDHAVALKLRRRF